MSAIGAARRTTTKLILSLALLLAVKGASAADSQENAAISWQEPLTVDEGEAYVGPWEMNESDFRYVTDPTVALGDDGTLAAVWVDNAQQDVFLQQYRADDEPQFNRPVNISRSPDTFSWLPEVAFGTGDQTYILWQEIIFSGGSHGGEIFFAHSDDGGSSFSEPLNLSETKAGAGKGRLTEERWDNGSLDLLVSDTEVDGEVDGSVDDLLLAAWTEYQGGLFFRRSEDGGKTFYEKLQVSGSKREPARAPALARAPDGRIYLAWTVGEDAAADIHVAVSDDNGESFGPTQVVHQSDGHSDLPRLAIGEDGTVHLVYAESQSGPFGQYHIRYTQLSESGEAAFDPRRITPDNRAAASAEAPSVAINDNGLLFVLWENNGLPDDYARGLGFAYSTDAGNRFSEPNLVPGSLDPAGGINGTLQGELGTKLSINNKGEIAVSNGYFDMGNRSRVVVIRGAFEER